jgi:lipoprotein-releasing system permease protein
LFELNVALRYLVPKKRALSTALISVLSVTVISLVVWLVLVFLSVTAGIEKNWLSKLTSLHAPLRISPTDEYYKSYYYQIDTIASASNYTVKTIGEKAASPLSDPYSPDTDMEIPLYWSKSDSVDPVKKAVEELDRLKSQFPEMRYQDFEIGGALLKLELVREGRISTLSQMSYLLSLSDENPRLAELLIPNESLAYARVEQGRIELPQGSPASILLPKSYRDSGVELGDRGTLAYSAPSAAASQDHRIPIRVAGFYDPGFQSLGNRCLIVPNSITREIYASAQTFSPDGTPTNGIFIWPKDFSQIEPLKEELALRFEQAGISKYWRISSYEEYEFSKDILTQFRSDRTLFTLVAGIILLVACCNIISLLILLVNDKKREIAILQSMGASHKSIAFIFAMCGTTMGLLSCVLGGTAALVTLHSIDSLVAILSALQGHAAFNPAFFGQHLPDQLSSDALLFVLIATPLLSLLAGLIPAIKASRIKPSQVLRAE